MTQDSLLAGLLAKLSMFDSLVVLKNDSHCRSENGIYFLGCEKSGRGIFPRMQSEKTNRREKPVWPAAARCRNQDLIIILPTEPIELLVIEVYRMTVSRRTFLAASAAAAVSLQHAEARTDANSELRVAVLGVNGRGRTHIQHFQKQPGVEVAMLCDPDEKVLAQRAASFEQAYGKPVETVTDMRRVFDRDDIDIVTIATPNHWHSLATIWACEAGKDVYVEKPGSHNIYEGRQMVEAAKKNKRIVQHGVQLRSSPSIREGVQHLRDGLIGDVYMARGLVFRRRGSIGNKPDMKSPPKNINWDLWQGPAQDRAFSERLVHYNWHWHWDYGNGDVGNQGTHEADMCQWGLDVQFPSEVVAMGGKFLWSDDKETPEVLSSSYYYPEENKMIQFEVRHWNTNPESGVGVGNIFYGSEGYMVIDGYSKYETFLGPKRERGPRRQGGDAMTEHVSNFLGAVRDRNTESQNGPVESAHYSAGLAHLGNIAYRLGRKLHFDPKTEQFVNDSDANEMLTREYREPFVVEDQNAQGNSQGNSQQVSEPRRFSRRRMRLNRRGR